MKTETNYQIENKCHNRRCVSSHRQPEQFIRQCNSCLTLI